MGKKEDLIRYRTNLQGEIDSEEEQQELELIYEATGLTDAEARPLAPRWNHLAGLVFRHGEHFYNFQGLRQFKEKFAPEWEPKYLASSSGLALPRILANIAALTSRGLKGAIAK